MTEQRRRRNIDDVDVDPDEALAAYDVPPEEERLGGEPADDEERRR